jgi:serine/threonine protein phosphatase 1
MRVLAIGDIHGCSRALDLVLAAVEVGPTDLVIALGDYVDRGPDSYGVLDRLLALRRRCRLVALRGNHDQMMLDARAGPEGLEVWLAYGGRETLASYAVLGDAGKLVDVPEAHWEFLETGCVDWYETATHFFVHANADPDLPLGEQPGHLLRWEKLDRPRPHSSGKVMVCGHSCQRSGVPLNLGHTVCLDTWVYGAGWLTCLDVAGGRVWQANQAGRQRTAHLEDFSAPAAPGAGGSCA